MNAGVVEGTGVLNSHPGGELHGHTCTPTATVTVSSLPWCQRYHLTVFKGSVGVLASTPGGSLGIIHIQNYTRLRGVYQGRLIKFLISRCKACGMRCMD